MEQASEIKKMIKENKCSLVKIAEMVGVKPNVVYSIKENRTFNWLREGGGIDA